ncbi:MAG: hypothetical protein JXA73_03260 [Acidobacteria bacterium]|nr:hypothetical protein [Acidobacteriota bacterium]
MIDGPIREISEIRGVFLLVNFKISWTHYMKFTDFKAGVDGLMVSRQIFC